MILLPSKVENLFVTSFLSFDFHSVYLSEEINRDRLLLLFYQECCQNVTSWCIICEMYLSRGIVKRSFQKIGYAEYDKCMTSDFIVGIWVSVLHKQKSCILRIPIFLSLLMQPNKCLKSKEDCPSIWDSVILFGWTWKQWRVNKRQPPNIWQKM